MEPPAPPMTTAEPGLWSSIGLLALFLHFEPATCCVPEAREAHPRCTGFQDSKALFRFPSWEAVTRKRARQLPALHTCRTVINTVNTVGFVRYTCLEHPASQWGSGSLLQLLFVLSLIVDEEASGSASQPARSWWATLRQALKSAFRCAGWCRG